MSVPRSITAVQSSRRLRLLLIGSALVLTVAWGAAKAAAVEDGRVELLIGAWLYTTVVWACIVDARLLGRPILWSLHWMMFVMCPVATPAYLIWARKLRGLGLAVLLLLASLILLTAGFHAGGYARWGQAWIDAMSGR